jgi:hypothetical protein
MTIRDRTRPRTQRPRKSVFSPATLGTNPPSLDTPVPPGPIARPPVPTPLPVPPVPPAPPAQPAPAPMPVPPLYPEPAPPNMGIQPVPIAPTPMPKPVPGRPTPPPDATPTPGAPLPLYPEPPNMGIPGGPGSLTGTPPATTPPGGTIPPGYGLDFIRQPTPNELVANQLNTLLGSNSPYIRNAEQRGAEYAASRGNINSSIGAGAARRAALEAAMPIAQADADVYRQANAANFDSLSQLRQMRTAAQLEDWLSDSNYTREYNGRLAMMPIQSSMDMMAFIAQRASEDPAVWTPDVMSGWMNFFNMWQGDMFAGLLGEPEGGE